MRRFTFLPLAALVLLAACDSSSPDALTEGVQTFDAVVTSADGTSYRIAGSSDALGADDVLGGGFVTFTRDDTVRTGTALGLRLVSDDKTEAFRMAGFLSDDVELGTAYPIGLPVHKLRNRRAAPIDHFKAAYHFRGDDDRMHALGTEGTITFTALTDDTLEGTFAFDAVVLKRRHANADSTAERETVRVEGTFATARAEKRNRGGNR
jgi:hypothetical protein